MKQLKTAHKINNQKFLMEILKSLGFQQIYMKKVTVSVEASHNDETQIKLLPTTPHLPSNAPGKSAKNGHVLGTLPPVWVMQLEFLTPGFSLAQAWLLQPPGK